MTIDTATITRLISGGETLTVEFKSEKNKQISDHEIYENIVCLANGNGGVLLIGVENDGTITGARTRHGNTTEPNLLKAAIFNNTAPPVNTSVVIHKIESKDVIAIEVDAYPQICATKDGKCLRRVSGIHGPECQPFYPYEHLGRRADLGLIDYSSQTLENASFSDIDPIEIERLRQTIERKHGEQILLKLDEKELLKALQLVESQKNKLVPNITCIALLGREQSIKRFLPTHELAFQVLDNQGNVLMNDWFQFPLMKTLEIIEERFNSRNQEKEVQIGLFRFPTPDYSPVAFREALNNSVLHRDYSRRGTIYIQLYPDYLFISNPGGFLEGITLDNLLVHEPKPRNILMASVFRRIGLVETTGRGIDKIYLGQLWYGRPLPDYTQSDSNTVRLILKGGKSNLNFSSFVYEQDKQGKTLSLDELIILNHLHYERRVEIGTIAKIIQRSESYGRSVMERLVERGLIEGKGEKRGRFYHLSASLYRRLGDATGYVHTHGFDRVRQEAMILQYIDGYGRITRCIASDLCNLTNDQSSHLLRRMVKEKKLKLIGNRKSAFYERL